MLDKHYQIQKGRASVGKEMQDPLANKKESKQYLGPGNGGGMRDSK